jgi:hypothetical protein
MKYKVLTLWQPWALLLAGGEKLIETRPSPTQWTIEKGTYLIHAAKKMDNWLFDLARTEPFKTSLSDIFNRTRMVMQFGAIIGAIEVKECCEIFHVENNTAAIKRELGGFTDWVTKKEFLFGNYEKGRYAWLCQNPRILKTPIPYKNGQGYYQNFKGDESQLIFL